MMRVIPPRFVNGKIRDFGREDAWTVYGIYDILIQKYRVIIPKYPCFVRLYITQNMRLYCFIIM